MSATTSNGLVIALQTGLALPKLVASFGYQDEVPFCTWRTMSCHAGLLLSSLDSVSALLAGNACSGWAAVA